MESTNPQPQDAKTSAPGDSTLQDPVQTVRSALAALAQGHAMLTRLAEERHIEAGGSPVAPVVPHPWDTPQEGLGEADIQGPKSPYVMLQSDDEDKVFVRRAAFQMRPRLQDFTNSVGEKQLSICRLPCRSKTLRHAASVLERKEFAVRHPGKLLEAVTASPDIYAEYWNLALTLRL